MLGLDSSRGFEIVEGFDGKDQRKTQTLSVNKALHSWFLHSPISVKQAYIWWHLFTNSIIPFCCWQFFYI